MMRYGVAQPGRQSAIRRNSPVRQVETDGAAWAKRCVQHLFGCANWLLSRKRIPAGACARPDKWQQEFRADWRQLTERDLDEEADDEALSENLATATLVSAAVAKRPA